MARNRTYHISDYAYQFVNIPVTQWRDDQLYGRSPSEVKAFAKVIMGAGFIHTNILTATWQGEESLISGTKRVMACRYILNLKDDESNEWTDFVHECCPGKERKQSDFAEIMAKRWIDMPPDVQATLSMSDNEHRSNNDLNTFRQIKELERLRRWEEIEVLWRFSKSRQKTLESLADLEDWETVMAAYDAGQIAETQVKAMAKINKERQRSLLKTLKERQEEGKAGYLITSQDIKKAKAMSEASVLSGFSTRTFNVPSEVDKTKPDGLYVFINGSEKKHWFENLAAARDETADKSGNLYRLVKIS